MPKRSRIPSLGDEELARGPPIRRRRTDCGEADAGPLPPLTTPPLRDNVSSPASMDIADDDDLWVVDSYPHSPAASQSSPPPPIMESTIQMVRCVGSLFQLILAALISIVSTPVVRRCISPIVAATYKCLMCRFESQSRGEYMLHDIDHTRRHGIWSSASYSFNLHRSSQRGSLRNYVVNAAATASPPEEPSEFLRVHQQETAEPLFAALNRRYMVKANCVLVCQFRRLTSAPTEQEYHEAGDNNGE